ncbi:MAG: 50S ribosomal protein L11 methyltransferase, partial [Deltaproteobacteria bacterium]|nr:50S ribosomal protein L11 methyltransferase [Deltaproteobacteria bacterium]
DEQEGEWPLVLANIQLAVFLLHSQTIASLVAPKGRLFISGILDDQYDKCLQLWPQFDLREVAREGEWLAMDLVKKA